MIIATCTTALPAQTEVAQKQEQPARIAAFKDVLGQLRGRARLFAGPAGYFGASTWDELEQIARVVAAEASRTGVATAVGIDLLHRAELPSRFTEGNGRSEFIVAWDPSNGLQLWQQRSANSGDHEGATRDQCREVRSVHIGDKQIAILACGELFNWWIRESVRASKPAAVVDLAHFAKGFRVAGTLRILAQAGVPASLCSIALKGSYGIKHCHSAAAGRLSTWKYDLLIETPRVEVKFWDIDALVERSAPRQA